MQLKFKDLHVGDKFDFIDDAHPENNSFYARCTTTATRMYRANNRNYLVGSTNVRVYHVEKKGF